MEKQRTSYVVHVYVTVRVPVVVSKANSHQEAIKTATDAFFSNEPGACPWAVGDLTGSYADETTGYLVDEYSAEELIRSVGYDADSRVALLKKGYWEK